MTKDEQPGAAAVATRQAGTPSQVGEAHDRWWWVAPSVWTKRMLTRRARSEPTTKWFRLWDKVTAQHNLPAGFWAVGRNGGAPGSMGKRCRNLQPKRQPKWPAWARNCGPGGSVAHRRAASGYRNRGRPSNARWA